MDNSNTKSNVKFIKLGALAGFSAWMAYTNIHSFEHHLIKDIPSFLGLNMAFVYSSFAPTVIGGLISGLLFSKKEEVINSNSVLLDATTSKNKLKIN